MSEDSIVPAPRHRRRSRPRTDQITISFRRTHVMLVTCISALGAAALVMGGFYWGQGTMGGPLQTRLAAPRPAPRTATKIATLATAVKRPTQKVAVPKVAPSDAVPSVTASAATVAQVVAEPVAPVVVAPPVPVLDIQRKAPRRGFGVQIGAYESEAEALEFVQGHAAALEGSVVYIIAAKVRDAQVWHRIRVGHHSGRRGANKAKAKLPESLHQAALVVRYR